jgi:hypothetical protein
MKDRARIWLDREALERIVLDDAQSWCTDSGIESFSVVIRLVAEFKEYLERTVAAEIESDEPLYVCGSVFSGLDSFDSSAHAYRVLRDVEPSGVQWGDPALSRFETLRSRYFEMYQELIGGAPLQHAGRLLLDLFKLQVIWAGTQYSW